MDNQGGCNPSQRQHERLPQAPRSLTATVLLINVPSKRLFIANTCNQLYTESIVFETSGVWKV